MALHAQEDVTIANFDDVLSSVDDIGLWSGGGTMTLAFAPAPEGSPASGNMLVVGVPANSTGSSFTITFEQPIDPRNYVGLSFVAQIPEANNLTFVFKFWQSVDPDHALGYDLQDWATLPQYTGEGQWQEVRLPFAYVQSLLDNKLAADPYFPYDQYDQIEFAPGAWQSEPGCTLNMDDIILRASWGDESGIPLTKLAAFMITSVDGTIKAIGANEKNVYLKVYSLSGQEVGEGLNQVQVETKGVYIVKATGGNVSSVNKVVVQ